MGSSPSNIFVILNNLFPTIAKKHDLSHGNTTQLSPSPSLTTTITEGLDKSLNGRFFFLFYSMKRDPNDDTKLSFGSLG